MKKNIIIGSVFGVMLIIIFILGFMQFKPSKVTTVSSLMTQIKTISELNTVEMYFDVIISSKDAKKVTIVKEFTIPLSEKSFIFTGKGKVKAGIDLSSLAKDDIKIDDEKITLSLQKPKITSAETLEHKAFDEKDGLFNNVTTEDTLKAVDSFKTSITKQALENNIIELARVRAEETMKQILKASGYKNVVIEWKEENK